MYNSNELFMDYLWINYGLFMDYLWIIYYVYEKLIKYKIQFLIY